MSSSAPLSQAAIDQTQAPIRVIEITDLVEGYKFVFPVVVQIEFDPEQSIYIAHSPTFNLFTIGDTYDEAIENVKYLFVEDYEALLEDYPDGLSETAIDLLRLYCAFMGKDLPEKA
jgi:predicted RNase H-like HicB family nuclease